MADTCYKSVVATISLEVKMKKIEEVADMFGVHIRTVYSWIKKGRLRAKHIGRRWYIEESEIQHIRESGLHDEG